MMTESDIQRIETLKKNMELAGNKLHNIVRMAAKLLFSKLTLIIFGIITGGIALFVGLSGEEKL